MKEDKPCKGAYKYTPFAKSVLVSVEKNARENLTLSPVPSF